MRMYCTHRAIAKDLIQTKVKLNVNVRKRVTQLRFAKLKLLMFSKENAKTYQMKLI